jgi:plastocyanin
MRRRDLVWLLVLASTVGWAQATTKSFELALADGQVPSERSTLRVKKGDKVEFRWTSDRPIALHLHGYDLETKVTPQAPASTAFTATIAGRFPVTEHARGGAHHHRAVLYLEVHP